MATASPNAEISRTLMLCSTDPMSCGGAIRSHTTAIINLGGSKFPGHLGGLKKLNSRPILSTTGGGGHSDHRGLALEVARADHDDDAGPV